MQVFLGCDRVISGPRKLKARPGKIIPKAGRKTAQHDDLETLRVDARKMRSDMADERNQTKSLSPRWCSAATRCSRASWARGCHSPSFCFRLGQ
jgi:hypothetical protein